MEHILHFGINIDDDGIKKTVEKAATQQVVNIIKQDCIKAIIGKQDASNIDYSRKLEELITNTTNEFLEDNKEKILDMVTSKLVDKLVRMKTVKTVLSTTLEEVMK